MRNIIVGVETPTYQLYTWTNVYADGNIPFATCVDENGKRYNVSMDNIQVVEDLN